MLRLARLLRFACLLVGVFPSFIFLTLWMPRNKADSQAGKIAWLCSFHVFMIKRWEEHFCLCSFPSPISYFMDDANIINQSNPRAGKIASLFLFVSSHYSISFSNDAGKLALLCSCHVFLIKRREEHVCMFMYFLL